MPDSPMWRQIAEDLRRKIESGELGHGGQPLPTEIELRAEYGAARNTIRDAVKWLVTLGLVYTRSGQGTFVRQEIDPFITRLVTGPEAPRDAESPGFAYEVINRRQVKLSVPKVEILPAAGLHAAELRLTEGAMVISRHQQGLIDDVPYSRQTSFYPMELHKRGAERLIQAADIEGGAVRYVLDTLGMKEAGWLDRFTVRLPDPDETKFFGLPEDVRILVFEIIRTSFDEDGTPFRVTVTTYPTDRNEFVMTSGTIPPDAVRSGGGPRGRDAGLADLSG